jgi:hypothetical protein
VAFAFNRDRTTCGYACHRIEDMRENAAFDARMSVLEACVKQAPEAIPGTDPAGGGPMSGGAFERALEAEHLAVRAERLLRRPGALIEVKGLGYVVRFGPRRRAMLTVDEAAFRVLARDGALAPRREGGWRLVKPLAPRSRRRDVRA